MTRIKGPSDGPRPVGESDAIAELGDAASVDGVSKAEAPSSSTPSSALDPVSQVAARLRAGEIDVDQAIELLIDDAVRRQVGLATESARELEQRLRDLLRSYAAQDPFLAARIRRLTNDS